MMITANRPSDGNPSRIREEFIASGDAMANSSKMTAKPMHHRMARHHMMKKTPMMHHAMANQPMMSHGAMKSDGAMSDGAMSSGDAMAPAGSAMSGDK